MSRMWNNDDNARTMVAAAGELIVKLEHCRAENLRLTLSRDKYSAALDHALEQCGRMEELLRECFEFIDDFSDVKDGDDGVPEANRAMSLCQRIDDFI